MIYIYIRYNLNNKFKCKISYCNFLKKYTKGCAYSHNLQTTQNANILFHFYFGNHSTKNTNQLSNYSSIDINMLIKASLSITLKHFMNKHNFKIVSFEIITIYNTQLDHIRKLIG
jgi:hypothetical protein